MLDKLPIISQVIQYKPRLLSCSWNYSSGCCVEWANTEYWDWSIATSTSEIKDYKASVG